MPGPVTRAFSAQLFTPDLRRLFIEIGKERPAEFMEVFNVETMQWNPSKDAQYSGMGTMPTKPEGTQFVLDQPITGGTVTYTAVAYGLGFETTWENWDDDLYSFWPEMASELARAARNRQEVQAWAILNNAFSASFTGFDGVSLCNTAHPGLDGINRPNRPTPDVGFSITGIQNMIHRFESMTDERNLPRLMAPTMMLVSDTNKFAAREILGSLGKPYTADNEINALIDEDLSWMICHYFTSATQWFGVAPKGTHDMNFLWKNQPTFDSFDDPRTKSAVFTAYQRFATGFGSWRGIDGSTG
jgi:hypothetical protein